MIKRGEFRVPFETVEKEYPHRTKKSMICGKNNSYYLITTALVRVGCIQIGEP